jgi:formylglycine-generating enzyme required for sulfatase activity
MARALPLVGTVGLLVAGLVVAAVWLLATPTPGSASQSQPSASASQTVNVESMTAIIGLSEDNKENVLTLCWRASTNPNEECRRAWLEQLGEFPHREVNTPPLSVDIHEVSNATYQDCVLAGDCPERDWQECRYYSIFRYEFGRDVPDDFRAPERPAVCVTFEQANALCSWRDMRLPTADEWEALARAGDDRLWPWGRFWAPGILNWGEFDMMAYPIAGRLDGEQNSAPVDAYPDGANPSGLLNVLGNVAEWTRARDDDPQGHAGVRGGSYTDNAMDLRLSRHATIPADQARSNVGIRCVADR